MGPSTKSGHSMATPKKNICILSIPQLTDMYFPGLLLGFVTHVVVRTLFGGLSFLVTPTSSHWLSSCPQAGHHNHLHIVSTAIGNCLYSSGSPHDDEASPFAFIQVTKSFWMKTSTCRDGTLTNQPNKMGMTTHLHHPYILCVVSMNNIILTKWCIALSINIRVLGNHWRIVRVLQ